MSVHIDDVLDYLDSLRVCQKAEDMESLMEIIHEGYSRYYRRDEAGIRNCFGRLREVLDLLPGDGADRLFSLVCDLCADHEIQAFSQGVCAGMLLMTEVNRVP